MLPALGCILQKAARALKHSQLCVFKETLWKKRTVLEMHMGLCSYISIKVNQHFASTKKKKMLFKQYAYVCYLATWITALYWRVEIYSSGADSQQLLSKGLLLGLVVRNTHLLLIGHTQTVPLVSFFVCVLLTVNLSFASMKVVLPKSCAWMQYLCATGAPGYAPKPNWNQTFSLAAGYVRTNTVH